MMYLLMLGWFLAHTSLAMTPKHSAIVDQWRLVSEICKSRALKEHVRHMREREREREFH